MLISNTKSLGNHVVIPVEMSFALWCSGSVASVCRRLLLLALRPANGRASRRAVVAATCRRTQQLQVVVEHQTTTITDQVTGVRCITNINWESLRILKTRRHS